MNSQERDYSTTIQQIRGVTTGESDFIANLSNIAAILKTLDGYFWVGFYIVKNGELVLGPFQGPVACTRIAHGRGVCGTAWAENRSILVSDVHDFPGHISCNEDSKSEVVIPIHDANNNVIMVLDVDSDRLNAFDQIDLAALEKVGAHISSLQTITV